MIWSLILNLFPKLVTSAITAYNKTVDADVAKYRVDGTVDVAALQAQASLQQAQRDIIIAEQGHWFTRLPRPVMGLSLAVYFAKSTVWDKVFAHWTHGHTYPLDGYTATLAGIVATGYFLHEITATWRK
jgi:hypothetical protein